MDTGEGIEESGVGAVGVRERGLVQDAGGALLADIEVVAPGSRALRQMSLIRRATPSVWSQTPELVLSQKIWP